MKFSEFYRLAAPLRSEPLRKGEKDPIRTLAEQNGVDFNAYSKKLVVCAQQLSAFYRESGMTEENNKDNIRRLGEKLLELLDEP